MAFTMTAADVLQLYKKARLDCQYTPARTWEVKGTKFWQPETITAQASLFAPLNAGLVDITYVFEEGKLHEVRFTRGGHGEQVVEPLLKPLRLRGRAGFGWIGLEDTIVVSPSVGDGEKEMMIIGLKFSKW